MNNKIIFGISKLPDSCIVTNNLKNRFYIDVFYKLNYSYLRAVVDYDMNYFSFGNIKQLPTHEFKKIYGDNLND